MVKEYIQKPEIIEAVQYTGDNINEIQRWCPRHIEEYSDGSLGIPDVEKKYMVKVHLNQYIIHRGDEYFTYNEDAFTSMYTPIERRIEGI